MRVMRVRMKMKMRMMTLYQPEISSRGGSGGTRGIEPGPAGGEGGLTGKFQGFQLPAYSLLKQEQLQLAQLAFVKSDRRRSKK